MNESELLNEAIDLLKMLWQTNPVAEEAGLYDQFAKAMQHDPSLSKRELATYHAITLGEQERLRQFYKKVGVLKNA